MSAMPVDVKDYLVAHSLGTFGVDLFIGELPDAPDTATVLAQYAGRGADGTQEDRVKYRRPMLQVITRAADYQAALGRAEAVYARLALVSNQDLSGTRYLAIRPAQEPMQLPRDQRERWRFVFNAEVEKLA